MGRKKNPIVKSENVTINASPGMKAKNLDFLTTMQYATGQHEENKS